MIADLVIDRSWARCPARGCSHITAQYTSALYQVTLHSGPGRGHWVSLPHTHTPATTSQSSWVRPALCIPASVIQQVHQQYHQLHIKRELSYRRIIWNQTVSSIWTQPVSPAQSSPHCLSQLPSNKCINNNIFDHTSAESFICLHELFRLWDHSSADTPCTAPPA